MRRRSQCASGTINAATKKSSGADKKDKVEEGGLIVREMDMQTLKRHVERTTNCEKQKEKVVVEDRRSSLAAAIEVDSEREQAARERNSNSRRSAIIDWRWRASKDYEFVASRP
ncbi:hypothetical protein H257_09944 [Aphanomyces astaci]|uniref:Uncharacterized protein n=1 Tax=Aphanomyces astaci TaxID=112090 RepID=W4G8I3_APHAT|nr:hypothetical protein H257_09944 [Aphanomyces astaci]ETV75990.1 hypothetical protein H257_09944 [Aphanomyces astaci]|eukprot:XP_009834632.1 hypothetical protein H257_09944 [Aphanomyces astaci]